MIQFSGKVDFCEFVTQNAQVRHLLSQADRVAKAPALCLSSERAARAKRCYLSVCPNAVHGAGRRLSGSNVLRYLKMCSRASFLVKKKGPLPAQSASLWVVSSRRGDGNAAGRCASHRRDQCGFSGGGPQGKFSRRSLLSPQCHRAQAPAFGRIFHSQAGCGQRRADDAELAADGEGFREARCSFERHFLRSALNRYHGVISQVAEAVGLSRKSLYAKLELLEIDYERYRLRL